MPRWPRRSAGRRRSAPLRAPARPTRWRSPFRVTASCRPRAAPAATAGGRPERRPFWPLSIEYEVDDSLRPGALPRSVSPFARSLLPAALRATEQRSRRRRRRADRLRDSLRVCRRRHPGHARRGRPHRAAAPRTPCPGGSPRIPASASSRSKNCIGLKAARHAFQAWRRAALDFAALLRRLDIKCHLEAHSALTVASRPTRSRG